MSRYYASGEGEYHKPVTWWRGHPIYAAHFIVALLALTMVVTGLAKRFGFVGYFQWLPFSSELVFQGQVWRALTYGLVNPPELWFVVELVLVVWFGREVERHVGRRMFLLLYGGIYLITPAFLALIGLVFPMGFSGATGALAIFTAFATYYPNVTVMFNVLAKWAAVILVATYTLIHFSYHDEPRLLSLWATNAFAFAFVRWHQGRIDLPDLRFWRRKPKLRVLPDLPSSSPRRPSASAPPPDESMAEIDALLDKIARSGLASLTPKERAKLEQSRERLLRKGMGHR